MLAEITLIGYLGNKPDIRYSNDGKKYACMKISTNFYKQGSNGLEEYSMWHTIFVHDRYLVEKCETLDKGDLIYSRGSLRYSEFTTKDNVKAIAPYQTSDKVKLIKRGKAHIEDDLRIQEEIKRIEEEAKKTRSLLTDETQKNDLPFDPLSTSYDEDLPF